MAPLAADCGGAHAADELTVHTAAAPSTKKRRVKAPDGSGVVVTATLCHRPSATAAADEQSALPPHGHGW